MSLLISKYKEYLNQNSNVSLGLFEGNTPLVRLKYLSEKLGSNIDLFVKNESLNPTNSFKDRGVLNAILKVISNNKNGVICCSSGNLGISLAVYAARAKLKSVVVIPKTLANEEKIYKMQILGTKVIILDGDIKEGFHLIKKIATNNNFEVISHKNLYYCLGLKTIAFEICEQLGKAPNVVCVPVSTGTLLGYIWQGFKEYFVEKKIDKLPIMIGIGANILNTNNVQKNFNGSLLNEILISNNKDTIVDEAIIARDESSGYINFVSDDQVWNVYNSLVKNEGLFLEISSCVSIAGLFKLKSDGVDFNNQLIVTLACGIQNISEIMNYMPNNYFNNVKVLKPILTELESEILS